MSKKCICLYSGGMDSMVMLKGALSEYDEVHTLSFNYNQRHKKELDVAKKYLDTQKVTTSKIVDMSFFAELASCSLTNMSIDVPKTKDVIGHPQTVAYCPNRNMTMLSIATSYAESVGATNVLTAIVAVDNLSGYWDCTPEFITAINNTLALNRLHRIEIKSPLVSLSKAEIIKRGVELGADFSQTWTCYNPLTAPAIEFGDSVIIASPVSCGGCPACSARLKGFIDAKLVDPLPYAVNIDWAKYGCTKI